MAGVRYAIPDEPLPGPLQRWAVDPMWPLFAQMLGGSWLALPWFVFNAVALGSPDRRRETMLALASLLGSAALLAGLIALGERLALSLTAMKLLLLSLLALKLGIAYALYVSQARAFELWRHFGGVPRNGIVPVVAALFLEPVLLAPLPQFLRVVLA